VSEVPDWRGVAIRTNLLYDGTATPNLGIDFALGQHGSIGASIGLKPWPRWFAWDYDNAVPTKWRHRLVTLEGRWWPKQVYDGWFFGFDALYLHYNFASLRLPFGLYPSLNNSRLQGDTFGAGIFAGHSWWLGEHWRLELVAGVAGAYNNADRYECDHCSARVGTEQGVVIIPQLALNIAWDSKRRTAKRQQVIDAIERIEAERVLKEEIPAPQPDTVAVEPEPEPEPQPEPEPEPEIVPQRHPLLRPVSEYQPYTPDMVLRRSEGAETVLFEINGARLLREVRTLSGVYDNMPSLNTILDVTRDALADESIEIVKLQIIGFASIDGSRWGNERLALQRATAVKNYMQSKIEGLDDGLFELVVGGEAWTELVDALAERQAAGTSDLTDEEYREVLNIIDRFQDLDERERRIKALRGGSVYQKLRQGFLFDQRSAVFVRFFYTETNNNK
jgi:outer membrane protein OmpA-like peptidoglycan-associated protein